ncbi:hypothetical protein FEM48_Zijuj05G0175500 [Ziziphus jujuba var. spinosa]|uniref:Uncharacterized protein n=1 Tax=Ziziphus jujuba var. spinosa TaxID=714518 RepID=A0A978VG66_ZIZJJ|nr:hypothetical protein FEM48_Zijuj05G0175500 [Ziziphus jujuba var. spinosa]
MEVEVTSSEELANIFETKDIEEDEELANISETKDMEELTTKKMSFFAGKFPIIKRRVAECTSHGEPESSDNRKRHFQPLGTKIAETENMLQKQPTSTKPEK